LQKVLQQMKQMEKLQKNWGKESAGDFVEAWVKGAETIGSVSLVSRIVEEGDPSLLRSLWDRMKGKFRRGIGIFWSIRKGKISILLGVTPDLIKEDWDATQLIVSFANIVGGSGGGRKDLAQAGGKRPEQLEKALKMLKEQILRRANQ